MLFVLYYITYDFLFLFQDCARRRMYRNGISYTSCQLSSCQAAVTELKDCSTSLADTCAKQVEW